jgi:hypothetical protein
MTRTLHCLPIASRSATAVIICFFTFGASFVRAQAPTATPAAATPKPTLGSSPSSPVTKSAFDAQLQKLTRTAWTWETAMGKSTIKFAKDGTCVHTRFNGTFEIQKDDTVVVNLPTRQQVLVFDFGKGEYSGYDTVLKQKITGKRTYQK